MCSRVGVILRKENTHNQLIKTEIVTTQKQDQVPGWALVWFPSYLATLVMKGTQAAMVIVSCSRVVPCKHLDIIAADWHGSTSILVVDTAVFVTSKVVIVT